MILADLAGVIVEFSRGAEQLFGHPRAAMLGRSVEVLMAPAEREAHRLAMSRARRGRADTDPPHRELEAPAERGGRYLALHRDGVVFPIELSLHAVDLGSELGWLLVGREAIEGDTPRAERAERLISAQRLELLGTLASGVAHDLNNLLTPILAASDLLSDEALSPERSEDLEALRHAAEQGRHLVRQLLYFSRNHATAAAPVSVPAVAHEVAGILRRSLPPGIALSVEAASDLPPALIDIVQLEQVLLNLVGNAIQALGPAGGEVRAEVDLADPDGQPGEARSEPVFVRVRVMDGGPGVPEEIAPQVFRPFFTTKPAGLGTGLGLSVCRDIAQRHGGLLRLERGSLPRACFAFYVPVADPAERRAPRSIRPPAPLALRRVLAVDDDAATLRALSRLLSRLDLEVRAFTDPREALAHFQSDPDGFDAVITDRLMPAMSGLELAEGVRLRRRGVPILLVSGLGEAAGGSPQVDAVLAKPFRLADLREGLAEAVFRHAEALSG